MSFKAKLKVAGKEYNILSCSYDLMQETDPTGRPSSITRGGKIHVQIEGTGETDLFEWMCNNFERKDGSIIYNKRDSDATLKELKFKEGYLVSFREEFTSTSSNPLNVSFTISAKEINLGNGTHTNEWV